MTPADPAVSTRHADDPTLRGQVLRPYRSHCRYLVDATVSVAGEPVDGGVVGAACDLEIPESCYIDHTGHFNAVEFNLCFNQMAYYVMALAAKETFLWPLSGWSLADFWPRQLSNMLIVEFQSSFRSPIDARRFVGEIDFVRARQRTGHSGRSLVLLDTRCRFRDEQGGRANGSARIAITDPVPVEACETAAGAGRASGSA